MHRLRQDRGAAAVYRRVPGPEVRLVDAADYEAALAL
jgi:hypothetical protein